jgi:N-acetylneuraminic acid mutarotase
MSAVVFLLRVFGNTTLPQIYGHKKLILVVRQEVKLKVSALGQKVILELVNLVAFLQKIFGNGINQQTPGHKRMTLMAGVSRRSSGRFASNVARARPLGRWLFVETDALALVQDFWEWDQSTNTWTQKTDFGGTARLSAIGFSIGTKGYIGTGSDGSLRKDFWEWDQSTNTWIQKTDFGGTARFSAIGFNIGTKGYIGTGFDNSYRNDFWEFAQTDSCAGSWSTKAPMLTARTYAAAGVIGGKLYVVAGSTTGGPTNNVEAYDPHAGTWSAKAPIPTSRAGLRAGVINGKLYVVGGCINSDCRIGITNMLDVYDPVTDSWQSKNPMPFPRSVTSVGVIGNKLYVAGGEYPEGVANSTFEVYDATTDSWASLAPLPVPIQAAGGEVINGKFYVPAGGTSAPSNTLYEYDTLSNSWSLKAPMPVSTSLPNTGVISGQLYVVSGNPLTGTNNVTQVYNPQTDTWSLRAPIPTARYAAASGVINCVLYVTGSDSINEATTTVEAFTPCSSECSSITFSCPANKAVFTDSAVCTSVVNGIDPIVSPPSAQSSLNYTLSGATTKVGSGSASGSSFNSGITTVTYKLASDTTNSCSFTVTVKDSVKPTITAPAAVTVKNDTGKCSASGVNLGTPVTADNCGVATVTNNGPSVYPKGSTTVTWTVTDINGNKATASQVVTVNDNENPVVTCPLPVFSCYDTSGSYNIPKLIASDNCGIASVSYSITGSTSRSGIGIDASGSFNPGTSTITWIVKDSSNNSSTCQTTVKVDNQIIVSIPDKSVLTMGVVPNTVYIGYAPASTITLTANASGGNTSFSYHWSNGGTTASITVSPTSITTYTVTVTDGLGCSTVASKTINVIDVRCGSKLDKVQVCRASTGYCIAQNAVATYLAKGSNLGACKFATSNGVASNENVIDNLIPEGIQLKVIPNPTLSYFTLIIQSDNVKEQIKLRIFDIVGRIIETREGIISGSAIQVGNSYRAGMYIVEVYQGDRRLQMKLIKQP